MSTETPKQDESNKWVTAYKIHKMLLEAGVERKPQMMYRYLDQKLIPSSFINGQRLVKLEDAEAFVKKFASKHRK